MTARLAIATLLCLTAGAASAASFNCSKAANPDEIAICHNQSLSELDVKMATLYKVRMGLPMLMGARGAAFDEQTEFLSDRAACGGDVSCIASAYRARIDVLQSTFDGAMQDYCVKIGICGE